MGTYPNVLLIDEYVLNIQELAAFGLSGDDVDARITKIIVDAYFNFAHSLPCDLENDLLLLKNRLQSISDMTHPCLPQYKKTLEFAIALIEVDQTAHDSKRMSIP